MVGRQEFFESTVVSLEGPDEGVHRRKDGGREAGPERETDLEGWPKES